MNKVELLQSYMGDLLVHERSQRPTHIYTGSESYRADVEARTRRVYGEAPARAAVDMEELKRAQKEVVALFEESDFDRDPNQDFTTKAQSVEPASWSQRARQRRNNDTFTQAAQAVSRNPGEEDQDQVRVMLIRQLREYEDLIYFKRYKDQAEKKQAQKIIEQLKKNLEASQEGSGTINTNPSDQRLLLTDEESQPNATPNTQHPYINEVDEQQIFKLPLQHAGAGSPKKDHIGGSRKQSPSATPKE